MQALPDWELFSVNTWKIKVEGGHLYRANRGESTAMCFVPDIDLTRYQAHLRDAYTKGFQDGMDAWKNGEGIP